MTLKNLNYFTPTKTNLNTSMSIVANYGDSYQKVRKITMTVLEVYKGSKYSDTCISEVLLLGY